MERTTTRVQLRVGAVGKIGFPTTRNRVNIKETEIMGPAEKGDTVLERL